MKICDAIIIGGGASGLMCALSATNRGKKVCLIEHNAILGKKLGITGGGKCNFTNTQANSLTYLSQNPHFCKSALAQFSASDFLKLVRDYAIPIYEKSPGQFFCKESAQKIIDMLKNKINTSYFSAITNASISAIEKKGDYFIVHLQHDSIKAKNCIIATGGLSYPTLGASDFGYTIARQFNIPLIAPSPALVPLIFNCDDGLIFSGLAGVSLPVCVKLKNKSFTDNILFTHNGISGPAILQISSYWDKNAPLSFNFLPTTDFAQFLQSATPKQYLKTALSPLLPARFIDTLIQHHFIPNLPLNQLNAKNRQKIYDLLTNFTITPQKTAGYAKAEITKGGVDTRYLNSKTMESTTPGLYFIGEVVDVSGHLGGYNLQWAWSSGWTAGQHII